MSQITQSNDLRKRDRLQSETVPNYAGEEGMAHNLRREATREYDNPRRTRAVRGGDVT